MISAQYMTDLFGQEEMLHLSQLYDPDATAIDNIRVNAAIDHATNEVNSYLAARYNLPLTSIPLVLKSKIADIARYVLDSIRPREDVRQRYEDAIKWLLLLAKGTIDLGLDDNQIDVGNQENILIYKVPTIFNDQSLHGFV